jgi:mycobactin peptide synthetase MbtE
MSAELAAEQPDPLDPLVRWLVRQAEDLLERRIDAEIDLFDQGMTSARAAKLVAAIADECAVDIGIRPIFEDGRITALADAIRRSYPTAGRDGSPARSRTFS